MAAVKSILKNSSYPTATSRSKAERDREVALYHANLLQERKDIELKILLNTETLIDYPLASRPYDASNPSLTDAQNFKGLVQPFQPSDYDALIVERNINEHCGYSLCPNNRVKDGAAGKYRLLGKTGKATNFKVVEKEELEKWCSSACARRALYVRVQLSEVPAWERDATHGLVIDLLDEPRSGENPAGEGVDNMGLGETAHLGKKQDAADLTLERGDHDGGAKKRLLTIEVVEKDFTSPVQAPSFETDDLSGRLNSMHLKLEGHITDFGSVRQRRHNRDLEDGDDCVQDTDWKLD